MNRSRQTRAQPGGDIRLDTQSGSAISTGDAAVSDQVSPAASM